VYSFCLEMVILRWNIDTIVCRFVLEGCVFSMRENQIIDIDGFVHVVNGKVICFTPDVLDMSKAEDKNYLFGLSSELFEVDFFPAIFGQYTMAVLLLDDITTGAVYVSMGDMRCLFDDILQRIGVYVDGF